MKKKVKDILSNYLIKQFNICSEYVFDIEYVFPEYYLCPQRLDLISKILYVDSKVKSHNKFFSKEFYRTYIRAFLDYNYNDLGTIDKTSFKKHISMFDDLIDSISKNGIDSNISAIAIDKNNVALDGAHRIAIAIYFGIKIPVFKIENINANNNNYHFYKVKGLDNVFLDYAALKYFSFSKTAKIIYFSCTQKESLYRIKLLFFLIEKNIVYTRKINGKEKYSFIYVIDKLSLQEYNEIENKIKNILRNEKSCIEISSTIQEAKSIAEKFLNDKKINRFFIFVYKIIYGWIMDLFKIKILDNSAKLKFLEEKENIIYNLKSINSSDLYEIKKQYFNYLINIIKSFLHIKNRDYKFYKKCCNKLIICSDEEVKKFLSIEDDYKFYMYVKYFPDQLWKRSMK